MHVLAVTILIGKRLGGTSGIMVSLIGLLLLSAAITCMLAALFLHGERLAAVQAVVRGVVLATAGIQTLVALNAARPLIREHATAGPQYGELSVALVLVITLALTVLNVSAVVVVLGAAGLGMVVFPPRASSRTNDQQE
jgi:chromate transporter